MNSCYLILKNEGWSQVELSIISKFFVSIYITVCPLETDRLWQIVWPNTPSNVTRIQRCPEEQNWIGNRVFVYIFTKIQS